MFIGNFQGTYKCPSTAETLKAIKQKHDESLRGYVKHFCNARNIILYIQDIEIINTFLDGVSDIKTVEEIAMKKPRMVADLRVVASVCGKGPSKKKNDQEVNTVDQGDHKDHGDYGYHGITSSSLQIRKRRGLFVALTMHRSGVRSIISQDTFWKSTKLFWIARRSLHHHHQWPRNPAGAKTVGPIPPPMTSRWERST
jgi:hypothetical protein